MTPHQPISIISAAAFGFGPIDPSVSSSETLMQESFLRRDETTIAAIRQQDRLRSLQRDSSPATSVAGP